MSTTATTGTASASDALIVEEIEDNGISSNYCYNSNYFLIRQEGLSTLLTKTHNATNTWPSEYELIYIYRERLIRFERFLSPMWHPNRHWWSSTSTCSSLMQNLLSYSASFFLKPVGEAIECLLSVSFSSPPFIIPVVIVFKAFLLWCPALNAFSFSPPFIVK